MSVKETIFTDNIVEGLVIENHTEKIADHQTTPPKRYTDSSLISAMERAGNEDYEDENVEKKGIGTQATQAGIIETIIKRGYVERSGKNLCPTQKGISLIEAVPEEIKSPKTTAIWESKLQLIEKGEYSPDDFMNEINEFVKSLVDTYSKEDNINKDLSFKAERKVIGKCPKCGKNVVEYPKSYGCESGKDGCGFVIWKKISGKTIPEGAARSLLDYGKSAKLKGFKKKDGSNTAYFAYQEAKRKLMSCEEELENMHEQLKSLENNTDLLQIKLQALHKDYSKSGGVSLAEWKEISANLTKEEAKREEINVLHNHHLTVFFLKFSRTEHLVRVHVITFCQTQHCFSHPFRSFQQTFPFGVFAQQGNNTVIMTFQLLQIWRDNFFFS